MEMNKHLIIPVITVLLLAVGLSGCEETVEVTGDTDKVEITDYSVITEWYIPSYGTYHSYTKSGFYKHYPANAYEPRYIVRGTVKNIAIEGLDQIIITVLFCDSNHNQLALESTTIRNLGITYTKNFIVSLYSSNQYFKNIDLVEFEIDVT